MQQQTHIQQELTIISNTIAQIPFVPTYTIPDNYFTQLPLWVMAKTNAANYAVPNSYFNDLAKNIINKINNEADELPEIFNAISKENVYQTPTNYFNTLSTAPAAPVFEITKSKKLKTWYYLAAACITGIMAFVAFQFLNQKPATNNERVIAGTNVSYQQIQNMNVDAAIDSLSTQEVNNYLCDNGLIACTDSKETEEKLQQEMEQLEITESDLNEFIDASN